uniref:Uncharacterized protein n=1 Tax=Cucumis melo TaxID=3656 RepID=A0A9I9E7B6_CUCME
MHCTSVSTAVYNIRVAFDHWVVSVQGLYKSPGTSLMRASKLPNKKFRFDFAPEPVITKS